MKMLLGLSERNSVTVNSEQRQEWSGEWTILVPMKKGLKRYRHVSRDIKTLKTAMRSCAFGRIQ